MNNKQQNPLQRCLILLWYILTEVVYLHFEANRDVFLIFDLSWLPWFILTLRSEGVLKSLGFPQWLGAPILWKQVF